MPLMRSAASSARVRAATRFTRYCARYVMALSFIMLVAPRRLISRPDSATCAAFIDLRFADTHAAIRLICR